MSFVDFPINQGREAAKCQAALVDATVVSEHFWPPLQANDGVILHPAAAELLSAYNDTYSLLKKPRQLQWRDQLGLVELELEFPRRNGQLGEIDVLSFSVSPVHATLILYFHATDNDVDMDLNAVDGQDGQQLQAKNKTSVSHTASALATLSGLPIASVRRKMEYWINAGVVSASPVDNSFSSESGGGGGGDDARGNSDDTKGGEQAKEILYTAQETPVDPGSGSGGSTVSGPGLGYGDDDGSSQSAMAAGADDASIKIFQNFIIGMLKNFDSMPLERIHNMLKMYVSVGICLHPIKSQARRVLSSCVALLPFKEVMVSVIASAIDRYTGGSDTKYDKSTRELNGMLGALVVAEKIEFIDGQYKLRKG